MVSIFLDSDQSGLYICVVLEARYLIEKYIVIKSTGTTTNNIIINDMKINEDSFFAIIPWGVKNILLQPFNIKTIEVNNNIFKNLIYFTPNDVLN